MKIEEAQQLFLSYWATNPNAFIVFYASDMVIRVGIDAAYSVASKARSCKAGFIYMINHEEHKQIINDPIMFIAITLKMVVISGAEVEVGALYYNAREILPSQMGAIKMGHPQPVTSLKTYNSTTTGIMNRIIKQTRSRI